MGAIEFPGLAQILTSFGAPGLIIGVLLWYINGLHKKIEASQASHMADIKEYSGDVSAALEKVTQALNANNLIQEKAAASATLISHAVNAISTRLEGMESSIDDMEKVVQRVDNTLSRGGIH